MLAPFFLCDSNHKVNPASSIEIVVTTSPPLRSGRASGGCPALYIRYHWGILFRPGKVKHPGNLTNLVEI